MAKAAKKAAKKGGAKKASTTEKSKSSVPAKSQKKQPAKSEAELTQERDQANIDHIQQTREEIGLPEDYRFNPNEIDPDRSARIEQTKAAQANREKLNKEAEGQQVS